MNPCESYELQLLDYLYGLLEADETAELRRHLDSCESCRTALANAKTQQAQLAAAAKLSFPEVHFEAPSEPDLIGSEFFSPFSSTGFRWAVAAGILLVLGGLGVSHALYTKQQLQVATLEKKLDGLKHLSDNLAGVVAAAERQFDDARKGLQRISDEYPPRLTQAQRDSSDPKHLRLVLDGPTSPEAGAANQYRVRTMAGSRPMPAQVSVKVIDSNKQVVFSQEGEAPAGGFNLTLPPTLPLKADNALAMEITTKPRDAGFQQVIEHMSLSSPRYLTHLATDKPMYRPGEKIRFRSLTLDAFSLKPVEEYLHVIFALKDPQGAVKHQVQGNAQTADASGVIMMGPDQRLIRGIGTAEYQLDPSAVGGEYILEVREAENRFPPQQRKILVNDYQKSRLNKEAEFTRRSYGPGEVVTMTCKAIRVDDGKPVADCMLMATLNVDGMRLPTQNVKTDATGTADVRFNLPKTIYKGDASVEIIFDDGGNQESLVRPVPLVLKKLHVEFYPEGGDLVAGVPNRVYFLARNTLGKPAELKGQIVDDQNAVVAEVQTFSDPAQPSANKGMGLFLLTPRQGRKYQIRVQEPAGIEAIVGRNFAANGEWLPAAQVDGVVVSFVKGVVKAQESIRLSIQNAGKDRTLLVGAYCRGRHIDARRIEAKAGQAAKVELQPDKAAGGVYRVSVFEETAERAQPTYKPLAERLVYCVPAARLDLSVRTDKRSYVPGDKVKLTLEARNEKAEAAPAVLMVAVTDESVHKLADEKTYRHMPAHFLLTSEINGPEELEYADFLLGDHPSATTVLDLVLGTLGWRRFTMPNRPQLPGQPVLAQAPPTIDFSRRRVQELRKEYDRSLAAASNKLVKAEQELNLARHGGLMQADVERLQAESIVIGEAYRAAVDRLNGYQEFGRVLRAWLLPLVMLALLAGVVVCLARRVNIPQALPYLVTAACSVALFGLVTSFELGAGASDNVAKLALNLQREIAPGTQFADAKRIIDEAISKRAAVMAPVTFLAVNGARKPVVPMGDAARALTPRPVVRPFGGAGGIPAGERKKGALIAPPEARVADEPREQLPPLPGPFAVREYAHVRITGENQARSDFTETLFWHPVLVLPNGKAEVSFELCDSVTTFHVLAAGHTHDGRIGVATGAVESRLPLTVEPKLPKEVTAGDVLDIPVAIANNSEAATNVLLDVEAKGATLVKAPAGNQLALAGGQRDRRKFRFQPSLVQGEARLVFSGQTPVADAPGSSRIFDRVDRSFRVVPQGFPVIGAFSDILEKSAAAEIVLPEGIVPGTLACRVTAYPSTLADLQKGLDSLLREPHGCFEQTSSSNYPNLLILDYFKEAKQDKPEVARRAQELLKSGYAKLTSFECVDSAKNARQGYEWFGGAAAPHEALTAYGLMQFRDMARVHDVDKAMVERTYRYLLSRKDGNGGFQRNPRALDSFGQAPQHITDAYIVWALSEDTEHRDAKDYTRELEAVEKKAQESKDPYFLALVANSLLNCGKAASGAKVLQKLVELQQQDGHLDGAEMSITGSRGRDLQIETTALALPAWLKAQRPDRFNLNVQRAAKWIGQQRGGHGGFGATQSTIMALKALIAFAKANKRPPEAGDVIVSVGNQEVARKHFEAQVMDALVLEVPNAAKLLRAGKNDIRVELTGKNVFPFSVTWEYRTLKPSSADKCPVRLTTRLDRASVSEGESVRLTANVENTTGQGQGMTVAILGLPAGLEVPEDMKQLKDLTLPRNGGNDPGVISFYELQGRELVLYWRDLAPSKKIEVSLDLIARVPGEYQGPASRAYLYYNADQKCWVEPVKVVIPAK